MNSLTSTSSLLLFPTWINDEQAEATTEQERQYTLLRITASLPLPPTPSSPRSSRSNQSRSPSPTSVRRNFRTPPRQIKPTALANGQTEDNRPFRSPDGLLSPELPLPPRRNKGYVKRRKRSLSCDPGILQNGDTRCEKDDGIDSNTLNPSPSGLNLARNRAFSVSSAEGEYRRPPLLRSRTLDDTMFVTNLLQPPSPSLLRPKAFWKNHPRCSSNVFACCSPVVRRGASFAAGVDIDSPDPAKLGWNAFAIAPAVENRVCCDSLVCVPGSL